MEPVRAGPGLPKGLPLTPGQQRELSLFGCGLLAYASVDPLAQQVRMTHVAAVLPDHSDQHLAQRHRPSTAAMLIQGIVAGDVETGRLGHEPLGEVNLRTPCVPCLRNHLGLVACLTRGGATAGAIWVA